MNFITCQPFCGSASPVYQKTEKKPTELACCFQNLSRPRHPSLRFQNNIQWTMKKTGDIEVTNLNPKNTGRLLWSCEDVSVFCEPLRKVLYVANPIIMGALSSCLPWPL
ncbi:hypothetical protein QQP08_002221 [Theobroma cacao]|nr:hypothetical protein QQP08_002221 [Theobroma cacao]